MKRTWFTSAAILSQHESLKIRQIYLWLITKDRKIPIVAGQSGNFQLPGGKPEIGETPLQTIKREMFEETGIQTSQFQEEPSLYGYYLIENDPNFTETKEYLQIRYYLFVNANSEELKISVNERSGTENNMEIVKFENVYELQNSIPWIKGSDEYGEVLKMLKWFRRRHDDEAPYFTHFS